MVRVFNINKKTVCNIGFIGGLKYSKKTHKNIYRCWYNMIYRCYSSISLNKYPTYIGCSVDDYFLNFQNFAEWYEKNYITGFVLDKDILIKGNKIYGPDTCCFVPVEINAIFLKANNIRGKYLIGTTLRNNFEVFCTKYGKQEYLGSYKTQEEAFNIYKEHKEKYILEIAEKWKNKINDNIYKSLINYNVELTD